MKSLIKILVPFCSIAFALSGATGGVTMIGIQGEKFYINGALTYPGGKLEGTLPNARTVNATFDDANPATASKWKYPDTGMWDPQRQTNEFVAALPTYKSKGLLAVTLNFQGGSPVAGATSQPWINTAFNSDGSLKQAYLARMDEAIRALDAQGMVAILGFFYYAQAGILPNQNAVNAAVDTATNWVLSQGYTNVLVEVENECDAPNGAGSGWPTYLQPAAMPALIDRIHNAAAAAGKTLPVSVSYIGGTVPPNNAVLSKCDYILVHGNNQSAAWITSTINTVRGYGTNKPIVFNEDSATTANFQAATDAHASWGYHDNGLNNYNDGFQSPPTNWMINTANKKNFFSLIDWLATLNVVSRQVHGTAGAFDINLPFSGTAGIECRFGSIPTSYQLIYTFNTSNDPQTGLPALNGYTTNVTNVGTVTVTQGVGAAVVVPSPTPSSNQITVNLTNVADAQHFVVTLSNVQVQNQTDETTTIINPLVTRLDLLIGDVDANGRVDANDVSAVQNHMLQPANISNFRYDVNTSGLIDGNDTSTTRGDIGMSLP